MPLPRSASSAQDFRVRRAVGPGEAPSGLALRPSLVALARTSADRQSKTWGGRCLWVPRTPAPAAPAAHPACRKKQTICCPVNPARRARGAPEPGGTGRGEPYLPPRHSGPSALALPDAPEDHLPAWAGCAPPATLAGPERAWTSRGGHPLVSRAPAPWKALWLPARRSAMPACCWEGLPPSAAGRCAGAGRGPRRRTSAHSN